jgi:hypothetical protein
MAKTQSTETYVKERVADLDVISIYKELIEASIGQGSAYIHAKETLIDIYDNSSMTDQAKATIIAQTISSIATGITGQAIQGAIATAKENRDGAYAITKVKAETLLLNEQTDKVAGENELVAEQLRHMIRKYSEDAGRWLITESMMNNQKTISDVDVSYKPLMSAEDLTTKQTQIEAMLADIAFNTSKKTIMEYTRKDNIRMKATEQFAEFLKYISAADVVPAEEDFKNIRKLVTSIVGGLTDPDSTVLLVDPTKSFQAKE